MLIAPEQMAKLTEDQEEKSSADNYKRLKEALKQRGFNPGEAAEKIGIGLEGLRKGVNRNSLKYTYLVELSKLLGVDIESIRNGVYSVDEKSEAVYKRDVDEQGKVVRFTKSGTENLPVRKIPFFNFRNIPINMSLSNLLVEKNYPLVVTENTRAQFAFDMEGDSMSPKLNNGDRIWAEYMTDKDDLEPMAIYLVVTPNHRRVRYIEVLSGGKVRLKCHNKAYPDVDMDKAKILELALCLDKVKVDSLLP
jgi:hypothetical protein